MEQTIELPAFSRSPELAPNSIDPETRSVEVIWSSGARVRRAALLSEPHDEEISIAPEHMRLERLNAGAPLLKVHEAHDLDAVIGLALVTTPGCDKVLVEMHQTGMLPSQPLEYTMYDLGQPR